MLDSTCSSFNLGPVFGLQGSHKQATDTKIKPSKLLMRWFPDHSPHPSDRIVPFPSNLKPHSQAIPPPVLNTCTFNAVNMDPTMYLHTPTHNVQDPTTQRIRITVIVMHQ